MPCGPYSEGETSKYVFTAKNYTTAKTTCFAFFKCTRTNLCFWYNSVISHSKLNSCLKNLRLNRSRQILLLPLLSAPSINVQDFSVAQIRTGTWGIFYINTKGIVAPAQTRFQVLLPELFQGIQTLANYICADWSKCWAMVTVRIFSLVCVCLLFIEKVCLPLESPAVLFLENYLKYSRFYHDGNPVTGDSAAQQLPHTLFGYSTISPDEVPV